MSRAVAVIIFTLISVIYDEEVVDAVLTLLTRVGIDFVTILNRIFNF